MLRTIRSKFQIQEQRIIIKKVIMKSGKNITKDGCKVYIGKNGGIDHFKPILIDQLKTLVF